MSCHDKTCQAYRESKHGVNMPNDGMMWLAGELSKSNSVFLPVYSMLRLDSKSAMATEDWADNEVPGFARHSCLLVYTVNVWLIENSSYLSCKTATLSQSIIETDTGLDMGSRWMGDVWILYQDGLNWKDIALENCVIFWDF